MRFAFPTALLATTLIAGAAFAQPTASSAEPAAAGPVLDIDAADDVTGTVAPSANAMEDKADIYRRTSLLANLTDKLGAMGHKTVLGGYGEVEFHKEQGRDSQFVHHRYVLFIYSTLHPRISTATELELEFGGSPTKRDGVQQAGEALLEFSVIDFKITEWLIARGGILLVPFGAYNIRHDSPTQDLTERPLPMMTITPSTWFEAGAGFLGKFEIGDHRIAYEAYAINGLDSKITEQHGMKGAIGSKGEDNNDDKALVARVSWSPDLRLEIGASGYTGAYDDQKHRVRMWGADLTSRLGWFELQGEWVRADIDAGFVQGFSSASPANTRIAVPTAMQGGYLQTNMHFTIPWLWKYLPADLADAVMTGVVRMETTDTNTHSDNSFDVQKATLGLNFRPIENYVLKTETQFVSNSADGKSHHLFSGDWQFTPKFVASLAFLF
jgi:hypothetical protein